MFLLEFKKAFKTLAFWIPQFTVNSGNAGTMCEIEVIDVGLVTLLLT